MEEILQVLTRLTSLLEQYDGAEAGVAQLEMQNEGLYRMGNEFEKDITPAKTSNYKALRIVTGQRDALNKAIKDITGLSPADLRDRLSELKISLERAGEYALEETRLRGAFEILVEANAFTEEPGESRAEFEDRLSKLRKVKELSIIQLRKLVNNSINRNTLVGASDSVLSQLKERHIGDTTNLIIS